MHPIDWWLSFFSERHPIKYLKGGTSLAAFYSIHCRPFSNILMSQIAGRLSAKAVVFPVVMCRCESWTIKRTECQRIDAFELRCWRRFLRVPWTEGKSNQSILKEINPEYSLEGLMLKLKLQYFGHLTQRADSLEKTLMLGRFEGKRRKGMTEDKMVGWHH